MAIVIPILTEYSAKGLDAATADIQKAEGGWGKAGAAIEKATLPAGIALAGLGAIAMKGIGAAEEAAAANAKLSQVFESMGLSRNTQEALDYADALSKQIGVDDEIIKGAQTKLATFSEVSKSTERMARVTALSADLSAAGFGSMDSAAVMMGKALQDPVKGMTALSRVGVTLTKQQQEQITAFAENGEAAKAQAVIMGAVEKQVGGVAEASATGSAKMSVAFGEITEAIGAALLPAFEKLMPIVMAFATWAQENAGLLTALGAVVAGLAAGIIALSLALKTLAIIKEVIALIKLMNLAFLSSPWFWVIAAVVLLAVIIWKNWDKIKEWTSKLFSWLNSFIRATWDAIKRATAAVMDWLGDAISKAWAFVKWVFLHTNPIGIIINYWDDIKRATQAVWAWVQDRIKDAWAFIKNVWHVTPLGLFIDHLDELQDAVQRVFEWVVGKAEWLWDKLSGIFDTIGSGFDKVKGVADAINPFASGTSAGGAAASVIPIGRALSLDGAGVRTLSNGLDGVNTYATTRRGGGNAPVINIFGAVDPEGTARQVKRLLEGADVRQGRAPGQASAVAW